MAGWRAGKANRQNGAKIVSNGALAWTMSDAVGMQEQPMGSHRGLHLVRSRWQTKLVHCCRARPRTKEVLDV